MVKGLGGRLPAWCFSAGCEGILGSTAQHGGQWAWGLLGWLKDCPGYSLVQLMPGFSVCANWKKALSVMLRFLLGRNQLVCSRAETGGSSYACHGDSRWAEPAGNRGSQIGCADKRCSHTPTMISPRKMLSTEQTMQFFLTITCRISSGSLTGHCHSHQFGGDSGMYFFSHYELLELCQMRPTFMPLLCNF